MAKGLSFDLMEVNSRVYFKMVLLRKVPRSYHLLVNTLASLKTIRDMAMVCLSLKTVDVMKGNGLTISRMVREHFTCQLARRFQVSSRTLDFRHINPHKKIVTD
jgi:hypothetical protein